MGRTAIAGVHRRAISMVEVIVGSLITVLILGASWAFVHAAGRFETSTVDSIDCLAALDRLDATLRKELRESVGGADGVVLLPGGNGVEFLGLDRHSLAPVFVSYRVGADGTLFRNKRAVPGVRIVKHRFEIVRGIWPGSSALVAIELEASSSSKPSSAGKNRARRLTIIHRAATGTVAI